MYNDQLEGKTVSVDDLFLDPNNPRFWSEQTRNVPLIPDHKVRDNGHQQRAEDSIRKHGLEELKNSILRNGFLPLDRIVVRELDEVPSKFVVIEGNRRLAALKWLRNDIEEGLIAEEGIEAGSKYLDTLTNETNSIDVLVYLGDKKADIAWILQGIRHIGGIRDWEPAQQGKLVADQIDDEGLSLTEAGQRFGLSAQAVGRRYRSYKALEQMRLDPEFSSKALNKYYSLFEEAIRNKHVKSWLAWDNSNNKFTNDDNLRQFYEWITPDEDNNENKRRIHDPRHIKYLGTIIDSGKTSLLDDIESHTVEIQAAYQRVRDSGENYNWKTALLSAKSQLEDIPAACIVDNKFEVIDFLNQIRVRVDGLLSMANTATDEELQGDSEPSTSADNNIQL